MEDMNLKVFFANGGFYVGNLIKEEGDTLTFEFLFMLVPRQDNQISMMAFGFNMAKDTVEVSKASVMLADAVDALKADYNRAVGDLKAARAGIVLAPANALNNMPKPQGGRADVQKLI